MSDTNSESYYLCYDVRGIQQFIFSVPKLKYVVGASLLIDEFDTSIGAKLIRSLAMPDDALIFCGGGRGAFKCDSQKAAEQLRDALVSEAGNIGLDLRIGIDRDISEATRGADQLYPYVPESLEGEPCRASGLWPITLEKSRGFTTGTAVKGVHPKVWMRRRRAIDPESPERKDALGQRILNDVRPSLPPDLRDRPLTFFTLVRDEEELDPKERAAGTAADHALGGRNRWAVLAMDGNDMGAQFRAFAETSPPPTADETEQWLRRMSHSLQACTWQALTKALGEVIKKWWNDEGSKWIPAVTNSATNEITLPFRPLIAGGDDVLCLCHSAYAIPLAIAISKKFSEQSAAVDDPQRMWPATGGRLTISAGIAYTGVTLPLYSSIPYAESLLGSAKGAFRSQRKNGEPTPAALDWEHITESMLDTPAARRNRDLCFHDDELGGIEIRLTQRPYAIGEQLDRLQQLQDEVKNIPRSLLAEAMTQLNRPWSKRVQWLAATMKKHPKLDQWLREWRCSEQNSWDLGTTWQWEKGPQKKDDAEQRSTSFVDAVLLLEEQHRMQQGKLE